MILDIVGSMQPVFRALPFLMLDDTASLGRNNHLILDAADRRKPAVQRQ